MTSTLKGDCMEVLKALRGLGISKSLLEQVQASLVPKRTDADNAREKAVVHSLPVRIGRSNLLQMLRRASTVLRRSCCSFLVGMLGFVSGLGGLGRI